MAEYLYVCHFSNGHIKVGRSISPKSRIASHADRVACMGVELVEHHIVECVGHSAPAESVLIERCAELATKRNKSEWFEGLEYVDVCEMANESAAIDEQPVIKQKPERLGKIRVFNEFASAFWQANLAEELGVSRACVGHFFTGVRRIPVEYCPRIELLSNGMVRCEDLRPDVQWSVLRHPAEKAVA